MKKGRSLIKPVFSFNKSGKFLLISSIAFLLFFLISSTAFIILMDRILLKNAGQELTKTVELERLKLQASINSEIAIVLKMTDSPLIKRYFSNPAINELEILAFEEFAAYRRAFTAKSVFWVNDIDKLFYSDDYEPYKVDPENPDNYWYLMTLHETEIYNFNINYNPDLNVTNLWINAPVFDNDNKPIGIVGTGINLSDFIDTIYHNDDINNNLYFYNSSREITGAKDIELVAKKIKIDDELEKINKEILLKLNDPNTSLNNTNGIINFQTKINKGVAVIASIPDLDWYAISFVRFTIWDSLKTGMTVLFSILMIVMLIVFISVYIIHESKLAKSRAEAAREAVLSSIEYASKIQTNLLPDETAFKNAFSDYSIIWNPKDIVSGDIYWLKNFKEGSVLCVCDCTGHGTPGALLTMLAVSSFEASVTEKNCKDTANIIWELEKRLTTVLNAKNLDNANKGLSIKDGCDLAVLFISNNGDIITSSSRIHIFICDGENVTQIKGQKLSIGEGILKSKELIKTVQIPANKNNKFYIASDGLYDQIGGEKHIPFCYETFKNIILENHNISQENISLKIWTAFEEYRGEKPRVDDFELITFKPKT